MARRSRTTPGSCASRTRARGAPPRRSRAASARTTPGPRYWTGPFGMPVPASKLTTPPMPTRLMASRSSVMPSLVTWPFIQNQRTQGRADSGGWRKAASRSPTERAPGAGRGAARATTPVAAVYLRKARRDGFFARSGLSWAMSLASARAALVSSRTAGASAILSRNAARRRRLPAGSLKPARRWCQMHTMRALQSALPVTMLLALAAVGSAQTALQLRWELKEDVFRSATDEGASRVAFTLTNRDAKPLAAPRVGDLLQRHSTSHCREPCGAGSPSSG